MHLYLSGSFLERTGYPRFLNDLARQVDPQASFIYPTTKIVAFTQLFLPAHQGRESEGDVFNYAKRTCAEKSFMNHVFKLLSSNSKIQIDGGVNITLNPFFRESHKAAYQYLYHPWPRPDPKPEFYTITTIDLAGREFHFDMMNPCLNCRRNAYVFQTLTATAIPSCTTSPILSALPFSEAPMLTVFPQDSRRGEARMTATATSFKQVLAVLPQQTHNPSDESSDDEEEQYKPN